MARGSHLDSSEDCTIAALTGQHLHLDKTPAATCVNSTARSFEDRNVEHRQSSVHLAAAITTKSVLSEFRGLRLCSTVRSICVINPHYRG